MPGPQPASTVHGREPAHVHARFRTGCAATRPSASTMMVVGQHRTPYCLAIRCCESCTRGNDSPRRLRISSSALLLLPPWNATIKGAFSASLMQALQAAELREARRRPRLPEVQQHVSSAETMKCEPVSTIVLERGVRRGIAGRNGQPQRTKPRRRSRHEVLVEGGRQRRGIRFAFVLPDELAPGVDEIDRRRPGDGKHACPAALVILGELHRRAAALAGSMGVCSRTLGESCRTRPPAERQSPSARPRSAPGSARCSAHPAASPRANPRNTPACSAREVLFPARRAAR